MLVPNPAVYVVFFIAFHQLIISPWAVCQLCLAESLRPLNQIRDFEWW
jgi:hypothetical protein